MRKFSEKSRRSVYKNPWMEVLELTIDRDGQDGIYGVVERQDSVVIIVRVQSGEILMMNQYRFPTGTESLELPMGGIDKGETPAESASRELREETGLEVALHPIGTFHPIPGLTPQLVHVFVTDLLPRSQVQPREMPSDVDEILGHRLVLESDLGALMASGEITDGFSLCSLALLNYRT
jgi:8-oxo-dGTP pyrophosphatase MutT (NUDIX family)